MLALRWCSSPSRARSAAAPPSDGHGAEGLPSTSRAGADPADVRPFADGLRNVLGLAFDDQGDMFVARNGYDIRGSRPVRDDFDGTYKVREGHWDGVPDDSAALEPLSDPTFDAPDSQMAPVFVGDQPQPQSLDVVIDHAASGLTPPDKSLITGLHEWNSSPLLIDFVPTAWGDLAGQPSRRCVG